MVESDDLEKGNILEDCPVFLPPENLVVHSGDAPINATFNWEEKDLIGRARNPDFAGGPELDLKRRTERFQPSRWFS